MKLEFLASGSRDTPLIRFYGSDVEPLRELSRQVEQLSLQTLAEVEVHNIPDVTAISGCQLKLGVVAKRPRSLITRKTVGSSEFQAFATCEDWLTVHFLLEPLLEPTNGVGFQWLLGGDARGLLSESSIALLVSTHSDGNW